MPGETFFVFGPQYSRLCLRELREKGHLDLLSRKALNMICSIWCSFRQPLAFPLPARFYVCEKVGVGAVDSQSNLFHGGGDGQYRIRTA